MKRKSNKPNVASDADLEIPELSESFFRGARQGVYHKKNRETGGKVVRLIQLEQDVAKVFPDAASVNNVLRAIIENMRSAAGKRPKTT